MDGRSNPSRAGTVQGVRFARVCCPTPGVASTTRRRNGLTDRHCTEEPHAASVPRDRARERHRGWGPLLRGGARYGRTQRVSPGRHYFHCEGTILACYDPRADGDERDATPLPEPIYLAVDELETTFASAEAAGASFSAAVVPEVGPLGRIARRPWGERSFYATDPFGNPLCFVSRDSLFTGDPSVA